MYIDKVLTLIGIIIKIYLLNSQYKALYQYKKPF